MSLIKPNPQHYTWRSGHGRLARRRLTSQVRKWERRPTGQRQREVLFAFVGLLLLGCWSVSINVSSQPLTLLSTTKIPTTRLPVPNKEKASENLSTQRTIHEPNRSDSINPFNNDHPSAGHP